MISVQAALDLFDQLDPLDQLDRLMLIIGIPTKHQPSRSLSLFGRQDAIVGWAVEGGDAGIEELVRGLEYLIEKQQNVRPAENSSDHLDSSKLALTIRVNLLSNSSRDPLPLTPQTAYTHCSIGDAYSIQFLASHDCHVTVLCFGTSGRVYRLFPNSFHRNSRVTGSQSHEIPAPGYPLIEGGPPGIELVRAFATRSSHFGLKVDSENSLALYSNSEVCDLEQSFASHPKDDRVQVSCALHVHEVLK